MQVDESRVAGEHAIDAERAARLAALQQRRDQAAGQIGRRRRHAAAGSRVAATGLAATAVIGFTGAIAMANRPASKPAAPAALPVPTTIATTVTAPAATPASSVAPTVVASTVPEPTEPVRAAVARHSDVLVTTTVAVLIVPADAVPSTEVVAPAALLQLPPDSTVAPAAPSAPTATTVKAHGSSSAPAGTPPPTTAPAPPAAAPDQTAPPATAAPVAAAPTPT
ncbi:MAG: hypothetical protein JWM34_28, partial [Ilumatobacteraceae bacterium]|nr:hypothetical protein [Ilumatobacteraceae bacterium]